MREKRMVSIVYLAYGSTALYDQTVFSLLTLSNQLQGDFTDLRVVIYTDNPGRFEKYKEAFHVHTELLTAETIRAFKGPTGKNVHRVKTCVLKDSLEKYGSDVFYLDCDTFFLRNPWPLLDKLSPSLSILNALEYDLYDAGGWENQLWFQLRSAIRDNEFIVQGSPVKISLRTAMWNAGITGLSWENRHLTDDILSLTDQIFAIAPVFHTEQFAVSYMLQQETSVQSTEDYVEHYWSRATKTKFSYHFRVFLATREQLAIPALVTEAQTFLETRESLPVPALKREPVLQRLRTRLSLILQVAKHGHL